MGRVARYKKIKSFDAYSKKNRGKVDLQNVGIWGLGENERKPKKRSRGAELLKSKKKGKQDDGLFDLPPSEKDDFDMTDMVKSVKKQKVKNPNEEEEKAADTAYKVAIKGNVATIPKTDAGEKKVARVLNVESQVKETLKKKEAKAHGRMEGESKRAYNRRTKVETRQIIQKTSESKNPEKRLKKKEFLNAKKNKKKGGFAPVRGSSDRQQSDDDGDTFITGERAVAAMEDKVHFGEQAERPPTFRQLPRGAKAKEDKTKKSSSSKTKGMTDDQVEAEKDAMDMMRRRVQAQYAVLKEKRKRSGQFHL
jgi:hypothetical protein